MRLCLNFQLDLSIAPDVLSIEYVNALARLNRFQNVLSFPFLVLGQPIIKLFAFVFPSWLRWVSILLLSDLPLFAFSLSNRLDGLVNLLALLEHPFADVLAAAGALFFAQKTLSDAVLAKTVPTNRRPTTHYVVHANGALEWVRLWKVLSQELQVRLLNTHFLVFNLTLLHF